MENVVLAQGEINFGRYLSIDEVVDGIESVSAMDILHLADTLFRSDQLALTLLGPVSDSQSFQKVISI